MESASSTKTSAAPSSEETTAVPEVSPFVSFAKPMAPSAVFDTDKHLKSLNISGAVVGSHLSELVPEISNESSRRQNVAAHVGKALVFNKSFRNPEDEYRPRGPIENIMAWRMRQKLGKLSLRNAEASNISKSFSYILTEEVNDSGPEIPKITLGINQDKFNGLSFFERKSIRKNQKRHNKLQRKVRRLERGRKIIPGSDRRYLGFQQIVRQQRGRLRHAVNRNKPTRG
jgi:hypothetical protein